MKKQQTPELQGFDVLLESPPIKTHLVLLELKGCWFRSWNWWQMFFYFTPPGRRQ